MRNLKKILKHFEDAMAASAFAEASEFKTARNMMRQSKIVTKKVLLATDISEVHFDVINHAFSLSKRMGGKLEIFHFLSSEKANKVRKVLKKDFSADFDGQTTTYTMVVLEGNSFKNELIKYAEQKRDLLCVVLDASICRKNGNKNLCKKELSTFMEKIRCPVVKL